MSRAVLRITDGTAAVDLLSMNRGYPYGFGLLDWTPAGAGLKGGGIYNDSPFTDGRRLMAYQFENYIENLEMKVGGYAIDDIAKYVQELRRLLEKARLYWTSRWQNEPVWIEVRGSKETNTRYAAVVNWNAPGEDNPFRQPLYNFTRALLDDFVLTVEHTHWQAVRPGTSECAQASGYGEWPTIHYIEFNGTTTTINCGSDAAIDNLHDGAFTAEAWIRVTDWGEEDNAYVISKGSWRIQVIPSFGIRGFVPCTVNSSFASADEFYPDGEWHHVAMTWNDAGTRQVTFFLDGIPYNGSNGSGAVVSDTANDLHIGSLAGSLRHFEGDIGWVRISDDVIYTAPFTPQPRCFLPEIEADTVALWIREGSGTTIDNAQGDSALDGTLTDGIWHPCDRSYGQVTLDQGDWMSDPTCGDAPDGIYLGNKHNTANLSHVYVYDDSLTSFSVNLQGQFPPYDLLPATPAADDALYLGSETAIADSGPFCSAVFDLGTAQADLTLTWEYWNGSAWDTLTVLDNTSSFANTGVNSVHWIQPNNWVAVAVNSVTAYWVRVRVTAVGGSPAPPAQDNRLVYSITWPFVEVEAAEIQGDVEATATVVIDNESGSGSLTSLYSSRHILGLRSIERGEDFSAYINASDEQNHEDITVTAIDADASLASLSSMASGRYVLYSPSGAAALEKIWSAALSADLAAQYIGEYRCFLRLFQLNGTNRDFTARVTVDLNSSVADQTIWQTDETFVDLTVLNQICVVDMGLVKIDLNLTQDELPLGLTFYVWASNSEASTPGDLGFMELILIPTDEWSTEVYRPEQTAGAYTVQVDSARVQKRMIRANELDGAFVGARWTEISSGPFAMRPLRTQRLWVLTLFSEDRSNIAIASRVQLYKVERYLGMRGAG